MNKTLSVFLAISIAGVAVIAWDVVDANQTLSEINESRRPRTETHYGPAF